jgi:hypothetical protein
LRTHLLAAVLLPLALLLDRAAPYRGVDQLRWMEGCWEFTAGDRIVEEQWMAPRGGTMMGMSRTVRGSRTVAWETVLLREDSGGSVSYNAYPSGQPAAVFPAAELSDSHAVFTNPGHDFPQRISYRRRGDTLAARVEGRIGETVRGSDFPYHRTACPGAPGGGHH